MTSPRSGSTIRIARRFRGPPDSANGGYACGRVAAFVGEAEVRLHAPPPLERELDVRGGEGAVRVADGETTIATGRAQRLALDVPPPPTLDEAREATLRYVGGPGSAHPFPGCFVCGYERAEGDGLRIFPGAVRDGIVAAPFDPPRDLVDARGMLLPEIVWAALDCPGYFAVVGGELVPMLLGELAAELRAEVPSGLLVAYAWPIAVEGRKARCGSALATPEGEVLAVARATWIRLRTSVAGGP